MTKLAAARTASKVSRPVPETISQAATFDRVCARYRTAGFCDTCSAQAAWGHQLGFTHVKPPCPTCTGLTPPASTGERALRWAGDPTADTTSTAHPDRPAAAAAVTCPGCDHTWTATGAAHCRSCHAAPFATASLFDEHRAATGEHGTCLDPETILNRANERIMFLRDGMWRRPEMSDEQKLARFGPKTAA